MPFISIIIPVFNDEQVLVRLLREIAASTMKEAEIIVVDGGSDTLPNLNDTPGIQLLQSPVKGRAAQMNMGAKAAKGAILYFLHADTVPPVSFLEDIAEAVASGNPMGCFRMKMVPTTFFNRINSFFTRFQTKFSGGGDHSLYIEKAVFEKEDGFNEQYCIMEDFELVHRLQPKHGYHIIQKDIVASARKYQCNSHLKVSVANYKAFKMYEKGVSPEEIRAYYYGYLAAVK